MLNASNPYVFCYACAVEERAVPIYRRDGTALRPVELGVPAGLVPGIATAAGRVVALAEADLWREAAALAVRTASRAPDDDGLRWLSILVNQTAAARLAHAGSPGQPLLTNVLAGEYEAALDLMRAQVPLEAFALDGPLIAGTAAETDLATMAVTLLDYSGRAVRQRPADPAIHAVRALGLALAAPNQLERAREAAGRALSLDPVDEFLRQAAAFLDSIESAPGLPPLLPEAEELLPRPSSERFADDFMLGAGDRGHFVRALQQRLARVPSLGFSDPGRYYDIYDAATREAVIQIQREANLEPTGVVDGPTWDALEAAWHQPVSGEAAEEPKPSRPATHSRLGAPIVYLTFDDGPHPTWTPKVLELLSHYGVTATFFLLGVEVAKFPHIANAIVDAGHEAENHTFDHVRLDETSREDIVSQVLSTDQALRDAVGERVEPIACLRPPYGATDKRVNRIAAELGKAIVPWTVDPQDWRRPGAAQIASHVLANVHPGAIVLLHDGGRERSQTVAALETVLRGLSKRGYVFGVLCR
ncbi:MAG: polysaccharide deacetylase family protein [Actinomycetia bacterium]|nr:polysaccharide deacetylase family protein [Actinomycetes bacterium]